MTEPTTGVLQTLGINWMLFLAQLINFGLVLYVVYRFIFKSVLKTMDDRAKKIGQGLTDADKAKKQLEEAEAHKKAVLQAAKREANGLVDAAKEKAEQEKQKIVDSTQADLDRQLEEARARLKHEKEGIIGAIKNEMADLVTLATEKVSAGAVNVAGQRDLVKQAIDELEAENV